MNAFFARGGSITLPRTGTPEWSVFEELQSAEGDDPIDFVTFFRHSGLTDESQARAFYNAHIFNAPRRPDGEIMKDAAREAYKRQAGEVEARNVEARRDMTAAQRRETPPWLTQDRTDAQQIVRYAPSDPGDIRAYLTDLMK